MSALMVAFIPFTAFERVILFHFYVRGSFVQDSGLLAFLMWHRDLALTEPASIGRSSFFSVHVAPVFLILSAISRMLPVSMAEFFAGYIGFCQAVLGLSVFWILVAGFNMWEGTSLVVATTLALGFAFNGLALAITRYPHFEVLIPAAFLLFIVFHFLGKYRIAALSFVVGLLTREDAGLHYAAVLTVLVAFRMWKGKALASQRCEIGYICVGALYSVAALLFQHFAFPDQSSFARIYLGYPPLSHLDTSLAAKRTLYFIMYRSYIWAPALGVAFWSIRTCNPLLLVGYIACLPWTVLNLSAASELAGSLSSYYAFPFLIGLGWPLIGLLLHTQGTQRSSNERGSVIAFGGIILLTFLPSADIHNPGHLEFPRDFLASVTWQREIATNRAVAALSGARPELGHLLVDDSVAALDPDGFSQSEILRWAEPKRPTAVVFFTNGYDAARLRTLAAASGLDWHYRIPATEIELMASRDLAGLTSLRGMLEALPPSQH